MKMRAEELVGRMSQLVESSEDWHEVGSQDEPAFENSWANASGYDTAAFYKQIDIVYLKGAVDSGTNNTTAFTLPVGYRPSAYKVFATMQLTTATATRVFINTDGTVVPESGSGGGNSLEGIIFRV